MKVICNSVAKKWCAKRSHARPHEKMAKCINYECMGGDYRRHKCKCVTTK